MFFLAFEWKRRVRVSRLCLRPYHVEAFFIAHALVSGLLVEFDMDILAEMGIVMIQLRVVCKIRKGSNDGRCRTHVDQKRRSKQEMNIHRGKTSKHRVSKEYFFLLLGFSQSQHGHLVIIETPCISYVVFLSVDVAHGQSSDCRKTR